MSQTSILQWKENEMKRLDELRDKKIREQGKIPYYKMKEGDNTLILLPVKTEAVDGKYGAQVVFHIQVDEKEYLLAVGEGGKLHEELIKTMEDNPVTVTIERWGTGKETRYKMKK